MTATLQVLGCGDAFSTGGQFHTAFLLDCGEPEPSAAGGRYLIDCGATTLLALQRAGIATDSLDGALITHLHGDHFGGLPFVLLEAEHMSHRRRPFTVAGPLGTADRLATLREALYAGSTEPPAPFPLELVHLIPGEPAAVGPLTVTSFPAAHPSGAPALMLRLEVGGKTIAFSGDTGWTEDLFRLAQGADLFVCEAVTYDRPLPFHLAYRTLAERRDDLACRRLVLTHLGPDLLPRARAGELDIEHAEEGTTLQL